MFVLAAFGTALHLSHARSRRILTLAAAPGTIASAVSLGAGASELGAALAGAHRLEDMRAALQDKRFRIDRATGRIVVEGEAGFEDAVSPLWGRATFEGLAAGVGRRLSGNWVPRRKGSAVAAGGGVPVSA